MGKWLDDFIFMENGPQLLKADQLARKIEEGYQAYNAPIKICKSDYNPCYGDGFKFIVKLKKKTQVEKFIKLVASVQYKANLPFLQAVQERGNLYLITSTPNSLSFNNDLKLLLKSPGYKTDFAKMEIAHPVGIDQNGNPIVRDLVKYPHVIVSGTTRSGKSTALKSLLVTLSQYSVQKINIIIADIGNGLSDFKDLPHLSCSIIRDPEILANTILLLQDEIKRRIQLEDTDKASLERLPYIICVIDEFAGFIGKIKSEKVIDAMTYILGFSRHCKIHFVLSIHDPKQEIAKIELGSMRVKMVFQAVNTRKSITALGTGGAESLAGNGEMIFEHAGEKLRLKGFNVDDTEIHIKILESLQHSLVEEPSIERRQFTISDKDLQKKKIETSEQIIDIYSGQTITHKKQNDDNQKFASIVLWALAQPSVSVNLMKNECHVSDKNANAFFEHLINFKVLGEKTAKGRLKVTVQSIEDIPTELRTFLSKYVSESIIENAINQRIMNAQ